MSQNVTKQSELIPGTDRRRDLSQWFTSPKLAARVVEWAFAGRQSTADPISSQARVLEPSAGNGSLVRPLVAAGAEVHAIEIDERYRSDLRRELGSWGNLYVCDFLQQFSDESRAFDLVVMNPPYEQNQDVAFIQHALNFAPRVVAILRADIWYTRQRYETLWKSVRADRVAFCVARPFRGAETDFCVIELERRHENQKGRKDAVLVEWWEDKWF